MDQLTAHLDRGWDLAHRGDSEGAATSARRALDLDQGSAEAYNLLGYAAAVQGDYESALEHYRQALALDDTYLEAMLNLTEVYIHPLGDFPSALALCNQALELVETEGELVDTLLLKFDALLAKGDMDEARIVCLQFPRGPFENKAHAFLVGRALYEIGDVPAAKPLIEDAVKGTPPNPDAFYYLGLIRDEGDDRAGATEAFLRSRELDLEQGAPPWALSRGAFEGAVRRAIANISAELRVFLREEEIYIAEAPGPEVVVDGVDPRALLLLDAQQTEFSANDLVTPIEPVRARLFVYQRNIERVAGQVDLIEREVHTALERELRIHFVEGDIAPPPMTRNNDKLN
jgi:tetratricopeptide (TPR) repeat protein